MRQIVLWVLVLSACTLTGCDGNAGLPALWTSPGTSTDEDSGADVPPDGIAGNLPPNTINAAEPPRVPVMDAGALVGLVLVSDSRVEVIVLVRFLVGEMEVHRTELRVPALQTLPVIGPDVATRIIVTGNYVDGDSLGTQTFAVERDFAAGDTQSWIILDPSDECPTDFDKYAAGLCGCGIPDDDTDDDGTPDCVDECPADSDKIALGACGCGNSDTDADGDDTVDCLDACPSDPDKSEAGACGCGQPDFDADDDGAADCIDECPSDADKSNPGVCGCGNAEIDTDGNGVIDCGDPFPLPDEVASLTALPGDSNVRLSWDPSANAAGYKVYVGNGIVFAPQIAVGNVTEYTVTNLANGIPYTFKVTAYGSVGQETAGAIVTATSLADVP